MTTRVDDEVANQSDDYRVDDEEANQEPTRSKRNVVTTVQSPSPNTKLENDLNKFGVKNLPITIKKRLAFSYAITHKVKSAI